MRHRLNLFIELKLLGLTRNVLNEPFLQIAQFTTHNSQLTQSTLVISWVNKQRQQQSNNNCKHDHVQRDALQDTREQSLNYAQHVRSVEKLTWY